VRKPPQPWCPRSSSGERAGRLGTERRRNPGAAFLGFQHREHAHFAGDQEAQRVHRVSHPAGVGDDGNALPLRQMIDGEVEVVPSGAGKARSDFVIQPDLGVALQRTLHRRL
jgi:hypothetical protein